MVWGQMLVVMPRANTVVFSGFPAKSRRKLLIDFVKLQLPVVERFAGHADIFDLEDKVFAPGIRTSVAMIRLPSKTALFKFVNAWKQAEEAGLISKFGDEGLVIRAKETSRQLSGRLTENSGSYSLISKALATMTPKSIGEIARCGSMIVKW